MYRGGKAQPSVFSSAFSLHNNHTSPEKYRIKGQSTSSESSLGFYDRCVTSATGITRGSLRCRRLTILFSSLKKYVQLYANWVSPRLGIMDKGIFEICILRAFFKYLAPFTLKDTMEFSFVQHQWLHESKDSNKHRD